MEGTDQWVQFAGFRGNNFWVRKSEVFLVEEVPQSSELAKKTAEALEAGEVVGAPKTTITFRGQEYATIETPEQVITKLS